MVEFKNQLFMLLKYVKTNRWIIVAISCYKDYWGVDNDRSKYNKCLKFCEVAKLILYYIHLKTTYEFIINTQLN